MNCPTPTKHGKTTAPLWFISAKAWAGEGDHFQAVRKHSSPTPPPPGWCLGRLIAELGLSPPSLGNEPLSPPCENALLPRPAQVVFAQHQQDTLPPSRASFSESTMRTLHLPLLGSSKMAALPSLTQCQRRPAKTGLNRIQSLSMSRIQLEITVYTKTKRVSTLMRKDNWHLSTRRCYRYLASLARALKWPS